MSGKTEKSIIATINLLSKYVNDAARLYTKYNLYVIKLCKYCKAELRQVEKQPETIKFEKWLLDSYQTALELYNDAKRIYKMYKNKQEIKNEIEEFNTKFKNARLKKIPKGITLRMEVPRNYIGRITGKHSNTKNSKSDVKNDMPTGVADGTPTGAAAEILHGGVSINKNLDKNGDLYSNELTTLKGYASFSPAWDKNGNSVYIDNLGEIYNTPNNRGILKNTVNYPLAQLANFNEMINEQNTNSPLYRDKELLGLSAMTAPLGTGGFLTGKFASNLIPYMGKKIATRTAQGLGSGFVGGSVHGLGRGVIENKNPFFTMLEDGSQSAIAGGLLGLGSGSLIKNIDKLRIKNADYDKAKLSNNYYRDYERGLDLNMDKIGKTKLQSDGFRETNKQMPRYADEVIDLHKKLSSAKFSNPELPKHKHKYPIETFYRFNGDNVDYLIAQNKKGDNYFHKVTAPELSGTETEPQELYNSIITHKSKNFNPSIFEKIMQLFRKSP